MERDAIAELDVQVEIMEGLHALQEDVVEQFSAYGMGRESKELQSAILKLVTLTGFMKRNLDDMNQTMAALRN